ncbi:hypothetical protein [Geobacter sp. AOG2]|uniref:hypothetical protein n=1 Tax=Geobacter sp. AOG2 TaxID=1566347 RepID=UPI001CC6CE7F|nr:hypothetical protein [Geobacter sp. AOG2]GFE62795.1 hypothetical protein AOG2_33830 [Geobacter sp. AOG2]
MDLVQSTYRKRKKLYLVLLASVVALVVVFRLTAPPAGQASFQANLLKLACLAVILLVARNIFRCPNCEARLAPAFYSTWFRLRTCPKCGAKLTED